MYLVTKSSHLASQTKVLYIAFVISTVFRVSYCAVAYVHMTRQGLVNIPDILVCALKHIGEINAGFKTDDITGECAPMTGTEYRTGPRPINYYVKTLIQRDYPLKPYTITIPIPVNVIFGAQFDFYIDKKSWFVVNIENSETGDLMMHMTCRPPDIYIDTFRLGVWQEADYVPRDLSTNQIYGFNIRVTNSGYEICIDGVYEHTFIHRLSISDINQFSFSSEYDYYTTFVRQTFRLPQ